MATNATMEEPVTLDAGTPTLSAADDHASVRLPALRLQLAATARESDDARHDRRAHLGISSDNGDGRTETLRLRHVPPPTGAEAALRAASRPEIVFPPLAACAKREADATETLRVLRAMEVSLLDKQRGTSVCFRALAALEQHSSSGVLRALLQQIFALLCRAAYHEPAGDDSDATASSDLDITVAALDELEGHEYIALYAHAQLSLEAVQLKKQQLEAKLSMERALEQELAAVLRQLARDLHAIRTQHLEHHERVEAERAAVAQLEDDHAALIDQEQHLRRECDGLASQAERQRTLLDELQSKSAYLDFISRIPLKKHLEQKKLKEQEELLEAVVRKEEAENARLERELAALTAQSAALDEQLESDIARTAQLEDEVAEATRARDLTERDHARVRGCHTPRPAWDTIVARIPELANNEDVEWDEMQAALSHHTPPGAAALAARRHHGNQDDEEDDDEDDDGEDDDDEDIGGHTQELVGEILQWIERLQKHCGVNLHLSRLWHDVEEARVELNILQHQLDQAARKFTRYGGRTPAAASSPGKRGGATANAQRAKQEYICALGVHAEIPLFLRHQGKVKCHPLKKSELEALVRKVWTEKRQRERRNPHLRLPLEEVLYEKLHRKYGFQPLIAEWGYNILLSLDMFTWDAELELFLLTLTHAISDQVYLDQELLLDKCASLLARLSESYGNEAFASERRVLLKDALVALRKFFPLKTATQLQALEKAMIRDMHKMKRGGNDSLLFVDDILPRGANYPRGFFVKAVRQQHFKEIHDYYATLTAEIESRDEHKTGELVLRQVREAMLAVDPLADATAVWNALTRGMGVKTRAQLEMHEVVPYKAFLRQMNTTGLLKFALNFDAHAELHWSRLNGGDTTASLASRPPGAPRKSFAIAARSRSGSMVSVKLN